MPSRVGQHRPPVTAGLELGLARAQIQAPLNGFNYIIRLHTQVIALWCGLRPARSFVTISRGEKDTGGPVTDLRVLSLAKSDFPAQYSVVELSQRRRVSALQVQLSASGEN
jgi:hypothetical protein